MSVRREYTTTPAGLAIIFPPASTEFNLPKRQLLSEPIPLTFVDPRSGEA